MINSHTLSGGAATSISAAIRLFQLLDVPPYHRS